MLILRRMSSLAHTSPPTLLRGRRRALPALGLPEPRERRRGSAILSALFHVLIIALLLSPAALHTGDVVEVPQGAGGPGPAGGGGGGSRGTGGVRERIKYIQVATAPAPQPVPTPVPQPPPVVQPPKPVVPPPEPIKVAEPTPEAKPEVKVEVPKVEVASLVPGSGGGTGKDGTAGSGPGTGGGVGSGVGTGRGAGIGPGPGGGNQVNYPPSPTELFIPPLPMPNKVRGFHLVAEYDIDETGKIVDFKFTETPDGNYNKRLEEVLKSFRFRPGTTPDGKPIRMKAQIVYDF